MGPDRKRTEVAHPQRRRVQAGTGDGQVSQPGEVFENRDTGAEQDRVGRALPAALRVIDVDAVDADEAGADLDKQLGGPLRHERRGLPVHLGAPVPVSTGVEQHGGPGRVETREGRRIDAALVAVGEAHHDDG